MPGGFPLGLDVCGAQSIGANLGASLGTTIVTQSSSTGGNGTYGAWAELISATTSDISWLEIYVTYHNAAGGAEIIGVNLGVGAAGSEKIIANNLLCGPNYKSSAYYSFPLSIPKGTRITAQAQSVINTSENVYVSLAGWDAGFAHMEGVAGVDSYGQGIHPTTQVDAGSPANTKGAFTQITAATTRDYLGLAGAFFSDNGIADTAGLLDIAIGPSGLETVIRPNIPVTSPGQSGIPFTPAVIPFVPILIPAGTRLSARFQCTSTSEAVGLVLYGAYQ